MAAVRRGVACLVFGGASGLGLATAQRLVKNRCKVVIADLPSSEGDRVARDLGETCIFVPTDVRGCLPSKSNQTQSNLIELNQTVGFE